MKISACIIALNEADRIGEAIRSVRECCDEVLVVDGGSTDATADLALKNGARVCTRPFDDYSPQKNFAISEARFPWILSIDADERVSPALALEIDAIRKSSLEDTHDVSAYAFPRQTYYLGRLIRHAWGDDTKPRLFHRDRARWEGELVHEGLKVDGRIRRLTKPLYHHTYRDISDHVRRMDLYSTLGAQKLARNGRRASFVGYAFLPLWTFFRFYVLNAGFLDGWPGFVISALSSYQVMLKYLKLREICQRGGDAVP
ncbi:MAG: glycosyltransferase family 2 protein [Acidobacteria bacterium]|nr:glycosyltransferase family 2 protein [Acidobacteriota bacterium]